MFSKGICRFILILAISLGSVGIPLDRSAAVEPRIAAGDYQSIGLKSDGTLWTWGGNNHGQLGDGTTSNRSSPLQIGSDANWALVAAGDSHTIALKANGTLWAWGHNGYGQLGDGSTTDQPSPVQVGSEANWVAADGGSNHTIALKSNGTLWAWGENFVYQLGNDTTTDEHSPIQVGADTDWIAIAAGSYHNLALKSNGTLWGWGQNTSGCLGDGTTKNKRKPTQMGTDSNWKAITAAYNYSVALKTNGTLWAWGRNKDGQLGDGTTTDRHSPVQIGGGTNWGAIAAGRDHTLALKTDGTLWAWGTNDYGQLGDGSETDRNFPVQVGTDTDWVAIAAGDGFTLAMKADGTLWGWGYNGWGQLGNGTWDSTPAPTEASVTLLPLDANGPSLRIVGHFDGQHVTTRNILLRGTASDAGMGDHGIQKVTVNGIRANGDTANRDGVANWEVALTLNLGPNTITLAAYDNYSHHNSTTKNITIHYDLPTVQFNAPTYLVNEGDGRAILTVTLSSPTDQPVTVNYATENQTATSPLDYTSMTGTLAFSPYQVSGTISTPIMNDWVNEPNETFKVILSSPINAVLGTRKEAEVLIPSDPNDPLGTSGTAAAHSLPFQRKSFFTERIGTQWKKGNQFSLCDFTINGVAYGNGVFVMVGTQGMIKTSLDGGETWQFTFSNSQEDIETITFGGGYFVAGAWARSTIYKSQVLYSQDGLHWNRIDVATSGRISGIAYGNGRFVAVTQRGDILMPKAGEVIQGMEVRHRLKDISFTGLAYGQGLFVATDIERDSNIWTSPDGITWTRRYTGPDTWDPQSPALMLWTIAYGNGVFVAGGASRGHGGTFVVSNDGIHWEKQFFGYSSIPSISYGNGMFTAFAGNFISMNGGLFTSFDGRKWTPRTVDLPNVWALSAAYGMGRLVAAGGCPGIHLVSPVNNRFWTFYSDGQNMVYKTSQDGILWSSPTVVRPCTSGEQFSVWFDEGRGLLHYAYASGLPDTPVYYRMGTPNADGTITWAAPERFAVTAVRGVTYRIPAIALDSNGFPWVGYRKEDGTQKRPMITKSIRKDGTWLSAAGFPYDLAGWTAAYWVVAPIPLTDGKMMAIYTSHGHYLRSKVWNGASWGPKARNPNNGIGVSSHYFSAVATGDDVHVVFLSTTMLLHSKYSYAANSWSKEIWVHPPPVTPNSAPALSISSDRYLHLFWAGAPQANRIYYKKRNLEGIWDASPAEWIRADETEVLHNDSLRAFYWADNGLTPIFLTKRPGGPYEIKSSGEMPQK